jgi:hypothetical protein
MERMPGESVELPSTLLASVREAVGSDGVAALVAAAVEAHLRNRELNRILDELEAEAGSVPAGLDP